MGDGRCEAEIARWEGRGWVRGDRIGWVLAEMIGWVLADMIGWVLGIGGEFEGCGWLVEG